MIATGDASYEEIPKMAREVTSEFRKSLNSYRQYRWVEADRWVAILEKSVEEITANLKKENHVLKDFTTQDPVEHALNELFTGKIGEPYPEMYDVYVRAEQRLQLSVPPGFKDTSNKKDFRRYGDVILWFQLLDFAKLQKKPLIPITGDSKVDWWLAENGKTLGPRPELVQEMLATADVTFHMYSPSQFIEHTQKFLKRRRKTPAINKAIEELRAVEIEKVAEATRSGIADLSQQNTSLNDTVRLAAQAFVNVQETMRPSFAVQEAFRKAVEVRSGIEESSRQALQTFANLQETMRPSFAVQEAFRKAVEVRSGIEESSRQALQAFANLQETMRPSVAVQEAFRKAVEVRSGIEESSRQALQAFANLQETMQPSVAVQEAFRKAVEVRSGIEETARQALQAFVNMGETMRPLVAAQEALRRALEFPSVIEERLLQQTIDMSLRSTAGPMPTSDPTIAAQVADGKEVKTQTTPSEETSGTDNHYGK